jgi:hypothetical protein
VYKFTYEKSTSVVIARAGGAPTLDAMVIKPVFGVLSLSSPRSFTLIINAKRERIHIAAASQAN